MHNMVAMILKRSKLLLIQLCGKHSEGIPHLLYANWNTTGRCIDKDLRLLEHGQGQSGEPHRSRDFANIPCLASHDVCPACRLELTLPAEAPQCSSSPFTLQLIWSLD